VPRNERIEQMETWLNVVIGLHVLVAVAIIGLVLLQHGKGADMGSGFGGGASSSLFGATGSANFLSRATAVLATLFFMTSLGLAYLATNKPRGGGVLDAVKKEMAVPAKPAAEKPAAEKPAAQSPAPAPAPDKPAPAESSAPAPKAKDVPQ
jgi:preprotein translocase subunit SecG